MCVMCHSKSGCIITVIKLGMVFLLFFCFVFVSVRCCIFCVCSVHFIIPKENVPYAAMGNLCYSLQEKETHPDQFLMFVKLKQNSATAGFSCGMSRLPCTCLQHTRHLKFSFCLSPPSWDEERVTI